LLREHQKEFSEFKKITNEAQSKLLKEVEELKKQVKATKRDYWLSCDLQHIGTFTYCSKNVVTFDISKYLEKDTSHVRIEAFLRCGHEGPARNFKTCIWTLVEGMKFEYQKLGARYPQNSISFDSSDLWFPIDMNDQKIYVQCDDIQKVNCHNMEFYISAFKFGCEK